MSQSQVPKQAIDLLKKRNAEWRQSLPTIIKKNLLKGKDLSRVKRQFLRSGVDWVWDKPRFIGWSYYLPVPGRTSDRKPRIKAQRIADAMQAMPDMLAEYRESTKQHYLQQVAEQEAVNERKRLIEAASTRLTDMRELVKEFDNLDDSFFDGDDNYYKLLNEKHSMQIKDDDNIHILAKATKEQSQIDDVDEDNDDIMDISTDNVNSEKERRRKKITSWKRMQNIRKQKSLKFAQAIKQKPLLSPELDSLQEKLDKSREWEKMDPEDGDYDDGRTWKSRRSAMEIAYIQQLANEPNLEKEQEKHDKRRKK